MEREKNYHDNGGGKKLHTLPFYPDFYYSNPSQALSNFPLPYCLSPHTLTKLVSFAINGMIHTFQKNDGRKVIFMDILFYLILFGCFCVITHRSIWGRETLNLTEIKFKKGHVRNVHKIVTGIQKEDRNFTLFPLDHRDPESS